MKFSIVASLKAKILLLFFVLVAAAFAVNLMTASHMLREEKRSDLQNILTHAAMESVDEYMAQNTDEKTDISYLYNVPHNISILTDSDAHSISFVVSKDVYAGNDNEIVGSYKMANGLYLHCMSKSNKIDEAVFRYEKNLLLRYVVFLALILIIGLIVLQTLMRPLALLAKRCREYKDGERFESAKSRCGSEICEVSDAFAALVMRLENYRKKEKELFREVAHELKTPLAIMKARLDVYENDTDYAKGKFISEIESDITRFSDELKNVLFFESFDFEEPEELDVKQSIHTVLAKMEALRKRAAIDISISEESFAFRCAPRLLEKLLSALLENALTYAARMSKIEIIINKEAKSICIKNEKESEKYLFSSKIGQKILARLSYEIGFTYTITNSDNFYDICLQF